MHCFFIALKVMDRTRKESTHLRYAFLKAKYKSKRLKPKAYIYAGWAPPSIPAFGTIKEPLILLGKRFFIVLNAVRTCKKRPLRHDVRHRIKAHIENKAMSVQIRRVGSTFDSRLRHQQTLTRIS